ncbi:MAG TPA: adenylate/guanylate cyclase domain-containing protein [Actinomycetota bacterium]|jgi:class 3 adenylate cyclase
MDLIRRWDEPDETVRFGGVTEQLISIGGLTVSRSVQPAGWHWREHFRPLVGGEWCQAHHVGVMLEGRQGIRFEDGTELEYGPGDLYDIPPGHDGWTIGDDPCVLLEWAGMRRWVGGTTPHRVLASLLFTDIVDSTGTAARLGDAPWHDLLTLHLHQADEAIERLGGRRITTTGDGILASFDAAAAAVRCAIAIAAAAEASELPLRLGVHVGEVELAGDDVRGVTVHEASRVMSAAGGGEILVSEAVRLLCSGSDLTFEDAGEHELKGVPGPRRLYRVRR